MSLWWGFEAGNHKQAAVILTAGGAEGLKTAYSHISQRVEIHLNQHEQLLESKCWQTFITEGILVII